MKDTLIGHQNIPIAGTLWMSDQKETWTVLWYLNTDLTVLWYLNTDLTVLWYLNTDLTVLWYLNTGKVQSSLY
jgi:hypothetical protein